MEEKEKPTYEQLVEKYKEMYKQLVDAQNKLMRIDFFTIRLNWLYKFLENKESFDDEYVLKCVKEIQELMFSRENSTEEEK